MDEHGDDTRLQEQEAATFSGLIKGIIWIKNELAEQRTTGTPHRIKTKVMAGLEDMKVYVERLEARVKATTEAGIELTTLETPTNTDSSIRLDNIER